MTKKIISIIITIFAFQTAAHSQKNIDSLIQSFEKLPASKEKVNLIIDELNQLSNVEHSFKLAEIAYTISLDINDNHSKAAALSTLATFSKIKGEYDRALQFYIKEIEMRKSLDDKAGIAEATRLIGELYRARRQYLEAISYSEKAVVLFKEIADEYGIGRCYNRLAAIYYEMGPNYYDSSMKYVEYSIDYALKVKQNILAVSNYNLKASIFKERKMLNQAIEEYYKALKLSLEYHAEYYLINIYTNLADAYLKTRNFSKSIEYAKLAYEHAEKTKVLEYQMESARVLKDIYVSFGDSANGYLYFEKYNNFYEKNFNLKRDELLQEYEVKYKNKDHLLQITVQERELQELIFISVSVLIILVLIIGIIYFRNGVLRKKNSIITEQKEKLQELNSTKDLFFSIIAHDLKNPLGSFKAITEMMSDEFEAFSQEELKEFTILMKNSAINLSELLENLLTWSRTQRGTIDYTPEYQYIFQLVKHNLSLLESAAKQKNIQLINNINESDLAYCDGNMINTVIRNITTNAVKFTPEGGSIIINSEIIKKEQKQYYQINIKDSGVGMPEKVLKSLFNIGEARSTEGTSGEKGTGLGLIICKEFIKKHNGNIWAESEQGKGTTFHFTIPLKEN